MADGFDALEAADPEIADIIGREVERQNTTIQLIASENFTSPAVLAAQGSVLTNKYSEGYPGKRYYGGNLVVDEAEELARQRACALFGADHANVQPHSGANANMAVYLALFAPGDKLMGMRLDQGGHLTHGSPVNFSGRHLRLRRVRRRRRDRDARLRRDPRPRQGGAAEGDHRRRHRVPAHHRLRGVPLDRRRDRRAAHRRRRAHRRAHRRRRAPVAGAVRRRRHVHHAQDAARPAGRRDPVPRGARGRDRQGRVPGPAGWPADARDRGEGRGVPRRRAARLPRVRGADRAQRAGARRRARRRGLPHRVRRHRQPPDARRPPAVRRDRQGRAGGARPGRASPATRTRSRTTPRSRSSRAGCASAPPRSRPPGWASPRWRRSRPDRVGAAGPGRRGGRPGRRSTRPTGSARSTRRTPSSKPAGRGRRPVGGYAVVFAVAVADHAPRSPRSSGGSRSGSARSSRRTRAACTRRRCRRSVARRCSSASSSRWRSRRRSRSSTTMFDGLVRAGRADARRRRDVRGRRARRPARRVAAGEARRDGARRQPPLALRRVDALLPGAVRGPGHASCSRPTSRRWSPCIVVVLFANAINLIDGLDGLAAGIVIIAGHRAVPLLGPAVQGRVPRGRQHRAARRGDRGRHLRRVPAVQLQPGADLHGRRRRAVPRAAARDDRRSRSAGAPTTSTRAPPTSSSRRCSSRS